MHLFRIDYIVPYKHQSAIRYPLISERMKPPINSIKDNECFIVLVNNLPECDGRSVRWGHSSHLRAQSFVRPCFLGWNKRFKAFSKHTKGLFLSNSEKEFVKILKSQLKVCKHSSLETIRPLVVWRIKTLVQQQDYYTGTPWLVYDVFSCKGVCDQHADSRIVHQSCCTWINWMLISMGKPGLLLMRTQLSDAGRVGDLKSDLFTIRWRFDR